MSSSTSKMLVITPCQTMRGHTNQVRGIVHLPGQTITCSVDGSLRLWDLESGEQIGEDWRDGDNAGLRSMALSPNGKIVASGDDHGNVRLWDVETRKIIAKWTGHSNVVYALCWSADGNRVASGSWDGTANIWDVDNGKTDSSKLATGGDNENAVIIWDAKTGEVLHSNIVRSLAWGKKPTFGSYRLIRILNTATWQLVAFLEGHTDIIFAISLFRNNRLLASASGDETACLCNLDTDLPVSPPLHQENHLYSATLSPGRKVLVTACEDHNAYTWDVHAILKEAGLEDLLLIGTNVAFQDDSGIKHAPRSSLDNKSFLEADATRYDSGHFGGVDGLSPTFLTGMEADVNSSMGGAHSHSFVNALLARLSSHLNRFRPGNGESTEFPPPSRSPAFHPRALFARFSSLLHRPPPENDVPDELQQPSIPFLARLFTQPPSRPRVVEVAAVRDKQALVVARGPQYEKAKRAYEQQTQSYAQAQVSSSHTQPADVSTSATPPASGTAAAQSPPIPWWALIVLFLCCASPPHANNHQYD